MEETVQLALRGDLCPILSTVEDEGEIFAGPKATSGHICLRGMLGFQVFCARQNCHRFCFPAVVFSCSFILYFYCEMICPVALHNKLVSFLTSPCLPALFGPERAVSVRVV
jgi:hypothetical protein